jgi:DNA-binding NarL/FixJ family response regulator
MIKVLIAEDIAPILNRYRTLLAGDEEIEVVAAVESGSEAVLMSFMHRPDVVLLDIEMETRTAGLDAAKKILEHLPDTKIVILTVYEDDQTVFAAFQLGVTDYILKNAKPREIIACVKDAYLGRSPIRPVIAEKIRQEFQRVKKSETSFLYCLYIVSQLTQTEIDVLDLLNRGYTRQQICEMRFVEMSTVKTHVHSILGKFEMASIQQVLETLNGMKIFDYLHNVKLLQEEPPKGRNPQ